MANPPAPTNKISSTVLLDLLNLNLAFVPVAVSADIPKVFELFVGIMVVVDPVIGRAVVGGVELAVEEYLAVVEILKSSINPPG